MPGLPAEPAGEDLPALVAALRAANARLREVIEAKDAQLAAAGAALEAAEARFSELSERVAELERRLGKDSGTSSRPPSSDSPYKKKPGDRSLRGRSGRNRGKQPGAQSSTLRQVADPDEVVVCFPAACGRCGADLAGARVTCAQKLQEFEIVPPPPPRVTEYPVQARACGQCGAVSAGQAPARVTGRARYGPEAHAQAANLVSAQHIPVGRAAQLMGDMTGLRVSAGWMAGVRHKAAGKLEPFMDHVRGLLRQAGVLYADETPARTAGHLEYVHVACTGFLTAMHTGGRSAADIDAGGVLGGYTGVIVRDGYAGYSHLTDALHAWCGAQYAEPGIMRNGAAGVARVACRGGDRSDAGAGRFCIITGSRGRRGRGQAGDTVRVLCRAGSSARVPVLSAEGLRGGRSGLSADPRVPAIVRLWPGQPRCAAGSSRRCGEGYERRFSWQRVRGSPLL